jgi:hypothetical protein
MSDPRNRLPRPPRYLGDHDAETAVREHNRAEVDQLIEDLGAIARHPQDVENGHREDLINACARVIVSLSE